MAQSKKTTGRSKNVKQETPKAAKRTSNRKNAAPKHSNSKAAAKNDFVRQNIIALFLLIFGMVAMISITTNALGPVGLIVKSAMVGQLGIIAIFIALILISIGAVRLVYNTRFSLWSISPTMLLLLLLGGVFLYGAMFARLVEAERLSLSVIRTVFIESVVGENIGIIPYTVTYFALRLMRRTGMFLTSAALFLFVGIYYYHITFSKLGVLGGLMAQESGKLARRVRDKAVDFVTEEDGAQESVSHEKATVVATKSRAAHKEPKFDFLERYKADIAEFKGSELSFEEEHALIVENGMEYDRVSEPQQTLRNESAENPPEDLEFTQREEQKTPEEFPVAAFMVEPFEARNYTRDETRQYRGLADIVQKQLDAQAFPEDRAEEGNSARDQSLKAGTTINEYPEGEHVVAEVVDQRGVHQRSEQEKEQMIRSAQIPVQNQTEAPSVSRRPAKYEKPKTSLLKQYDLKQLSAQSQANNARKLEATLEIFGIEAKVVNIAIGPTITRYELQPKMGVKVSKILNLSDDLALSLAAIAPIRIEAPIPGTSLVGIEVPNAKTDIVGFRSVLEAPEFKDPSKEIPFALGRDVSGKPVIEDIARMPHLLVAGATGSGKSVCINTLICSILYKYKPEEIKMIMIDPKMVELSVYNSIPHLLIPVVTDMKKAPYALSWAVGEMNKRYKLFTENKVRDLNSYNQIPGVEKLPRIVIIVDELADLMMVSPSEVEDAIIRLAQKARACGMHLVIATQRPSVDVITGLIKANIPSRIAFAVSSQVDSRTILDQVGAEKLIGKGDMLFSHPSIPKPKRMQGSFITDQEVNAVVSYILEQDHPVEQVDIIEQTIQNQIEERKDEERDALLDEVIEFTTSNKQVSTSLIQRRFKVGYNRASRLIDTLEELGIVSESDGAKPRRVLVDSFEMDEKED